MSGTEPRSTGLWFGPLRQHLESLKPSIPTLLVDPAHLAEFDSVLDTSGAAWQWCMVEVPLGGSVGRPSLLGCITSDAGARGQLLLDLGRPDFGLAGSRALLEPWALQASGHPAVGVVWAEWDRPDSRPLLWVDLPHHANRSDPPLEALRLVEQTAAALGNVPTRVVIQTVEMCLRALPNGGRLLGTGSLASRGSEDRRMFVGLPADGLVSWLQGICWPGDLDFVRRWLPLIGGPWEPVFVQIEVSECVGAYLGLECRQTTAGFPERPARSELLAALVRDGAVQPAHADAVLAFPGRQMIKQDSSELELIRSFHLKVTAAPGGAAAAKVYLGGSILAAEG